MMRAAFSLHSAGRLSQNTVPVGAELATAYLAAGRIYRAGNLAPAESMLATNFLMDRSREGWERELARLAGNAGACDTAAPIRPSGALSGAFVWSCARGRIEGG